MAINSQALQQQILQIQSQKKRRPEMFLVQENRVVVREIYDYIKNLFKPEYHLLIPEQVQSDIVHALAEMRKEFSVLEKECLSPTHFDLQRLRFTKIIHFLQDLSESIYIGILDSFSVVEPRGLTVYQSIEFSWKTAKAFLAKHQNVQNELSSTIQLSTEDRQWWEQQVHSLQPIVDQLLQKHSWNLFHHRFSIAEVRALNAYFEKVKWLYEWIKNFYLNYAKNPPKKAAALSREECTQKIISSLPHLENQLGLYVNDVQHFPKGSYSDSWNLHAIETQALMGQIYIQIASLQFLRKHKEIMKGEKLYGASGRKEYFQKVRSELQQIKFLLKHLSKIHENLHAIHTIIANFVVSFSKIYQISLHTPLSADFLRRTFKTIHELLTKGVKLVEARRTNSEQLREVVTKINLFDGSIEPGLLKALVAMEQVKSDLHDYDQTLLKSLRSVLMEKELAPKQIRLMLGDLYEHRSEVTNASIMLAGIVRNFSIMIKNLSLFSEMHNRLLQHEGSTQPAQEILPKLQLILLSDDGYWAETTWKTWEAMQDMEWFLVNLRENLQAEHSYYQQLQNILAPVKQRITQAQLEKKAREERSRSQEIYQKKMAKKHEKEAEPEVVEPQKPTVISAKPSTQSEYAPFAENMMEPLLSSLSRIDDQAIPMILEIIKNPHRYFDYLGNLVDEYNPDEKPSNSEFYEEWKLIDNSYDLLLSFARMKFLQHGLVDVHLQRIPYNMATREFETGQYQEQFILFAHKTPETPANLFIKYIRVLMGYDLVASFHPQENDVFCEELRSQYVLSSQHSKSLQAELAYLQPNPIKFVL